MRSEGIEGRRVASRSVDGGAWVSLRHAAQLLQVSYSTAWRYARESSLDSKQFAKGSPIFVSAESVVRFVHARGEVYADDCCARRDGLLPFGRTDEGERV